MSTHLNDTYQEYGEHQRPDVEGSADRKEKQAEGTSTASFGFGRRFDSTRTELTVVFLRARVDIDCEDSKQKVKVSARDEQSRRKKRRRKENEPENLSPRSFRIRLRIIGSITFLPDKDSQGFLFVDVGRSNAESDGENGDVCEERGGQSTRRTELGEKRDVHMRMM